MCAAGRCFGGSIAPMPSLVTIGWDRVEAIPSLSIAAPRKRLRVVGFLREALPPIQEISMVAKHRAADGPPVRAADEAALPKRWRSSRLSLCAGP